MSEITLTIYPEKGDNLVPNLDIHKDLTEDPSISNDNMYLELCMFPDADEEMLYYIGFKFSEHVEGEKFEFNTCSQFTRSELILIKNHIDNMLSFE